MRTTHELKTDKEVFDAVWEGDKTYEIRFNDRGFEELDVLYLKETVYTGEEMKTGSPLEFTGREIKAVVSHILEGQYGLQSGWCILSIGVIGRMKNI